MEQVPQPRHSREDGRPELLHRLAQLVGRKFFQITDLDAERGRDPQVYDLQVCVKERQQRENAFLVGDLENVVDTLKLSHDIAMRQRNALRRARSAARIDQQSDVVAVGLLHFRGETFWKIRRGPIAEIRADRPRLSVV